jgi:outer membrane lipoprotein carrier protein
VNRIAAQLAMGATIVLSSPAIAQEAGPVLERAARTYRGLSALQADFRQVVANEMIGTFESRGTLAQAGASRLSMRFSDPPGEAIVIDGSSIWIYAPSTTPGQVIRTPIAKAQGYGVNLLAWLLDRPAERYHATYLRGDRIGNTPVDVVRLTPKASDLPFTQATLWLAQSDALPRRLEVVETSGNRRTLTLSKLRPNPKLPAGTFSFSPPRGVRVIDQ